MGILSRTKSVLAILWWRWGLNFRRAFGHLRDKAIIADPSVSRLRIEGIQTKCVEEIFSDLVPSFNVVGERLQRIIATDEVQRTIVEAKPESGKDFVVSLLPKEFHIDDPLIQLAIHPHLLTVVNGYLGLRGYLRAIVGWVNFPTPGPARETQLWHQDQDDVLQLKVFIYCSDVDLSTGPFCFIPGTHRIGRINTTGWFRNSLGRLDDNGMAIKIPESDWFIGTGRAGTVIIADTTGCHKGLKPEQDHRLLLMFHYTSGAPRHPRSFRITGVAPNSLTPPQKAALMSN